ncbi:MAG: hypothetical protein ACR2KB_06585 [Chitinophagaceae bacterium]
MEEKLVDKETEETQSSDSEWYDQRTDARNDIDTAVHAYNFLEQVDTQSPDVLSWELTDELLKAKKNCLLILCKSLAELVLPE